jgi:hypothetical protein
MLNSRLRSLFLLLTALPATAQIPGRNVNMVSGTKWPDGDPFLQRQNEPSLAVSSRNPAHLLAGSNDYRTVDLPGLPENETGDAWLGIFKSYDGGQTWRSTVHPGCPQKIAACDGAPALKNYAAGADPVVRAGTNGMFYYSGIAFTRDTPKKSVVFVSQFIDNNNEENGDPIRFVSTVPVATGAGSNFIDKPWMAVDIPRANAATCSITVPQKNGNPLTQKFAGGNLYLAWTNFLDESKLPSQIMFSRSADCGATWSKPLVVADTTLNQGANVQVDPTNGAVYITWRRFKSPGVTDAIMFAESRDAGQTFSTPQVVAEIAPFDQGTTSFSFRTNAYPTMTVDGTGRVYIAWSERNQGAPESAGDARVVLTTSRDRQKWTTRHPVSDYAGRGHQFMPAMTFGGGKVMVVFYDARQDSTISNYISPGGGQYIETRVPAGDLATTPPHPEKVFTSFLLDAAPANLGLGGLLRRHTIDVFAAQADPDDVPQFALSRVSQYAFGSRHNEVLIEQMQVNPPDLPLFKSGTAPFLGDYLDVAPSPSFVPGDQPGTWKFNTEVSRSATFYTAWTDNRDVRPPANGDWTDYTPPISPSLSAISLFDPTQPVAACRTGQAGMRNQNIYSSRITQGLLVSSPANSKTLGTYQRAFPVNIVNSTNRTHTYRLRILNQPKGGKASFVQVPSPGLPDPLVALDINVAPGSSASRMVFVRATDAHATVRVSVDEVNAPGGNLIAGGLSGSILLNPDPLNPDIANPDIANPDIANPDVFNPDIANPDIANPDIANPDIANPDIANPDIANPDIANPDIANPDIANPDIANPDIANPDIANPDIANPDIANAAISDITWRLTNSGTATATYSINFLLKGAIPKNVRTQLIIHRVYTNPVANGCALTEQPQMIVVANIIQPNLLTQQTAGKLRSLLLARAKIARGEKADSNSSTEIIDEALDNATVSVAPGETVYVTLRFFNIDRTQPLGFDPGKDITTISVSHAINTGGNQPSVAASHLLIATTQLPAGAAGGAYDQFLVAAGGKTPYTWSVVSGNLPPGLSLSPAAEIAGTITPGTPPGLFGFTVSVSDSSNPALPAVQQDLSIAVSSVALAINGLAAVGPVGTSVHAGDSILVTATVINNGSLADAVIPGITLTSTGTASADCGAPSPASSTLDTGAQKAYVFTCSNVSGSGTLTFSVGLTAIDHLTGFGLAISPATSNVVNVLGAPPQITVAATSNGIPYASGVWTNHDVILTFTCTPSFGSPSTRTVTVVSEGANQSVNSTCNDLSGTQVNTTFSGINIDKTPPAITVAATAGGQPYFGTVTAQTVIVTFTCTDFGGSGVTQPTQQQFSSDRMGQSAQGTCTDLAGNSSNSSYGPINIVRTPPQLNAIYTAGNGAGYSPGVWSRDPVTVTFTCVPAGGATVANVTQPVTVFTEAANQFVNGTCTDMAGNQTRITAGPISVDRTPPVMTLLNRPPTNATGWYNTDVTITWLCNDAVAGSSTVSRTITTEGAGQSVSATCSDPAGNTASASATVNIDKTPPVLTGGPSAPAPASGWYRGAVSVTFQCTDALSGVGLGSPSGNTNITGDTPGTMVNGQCRDQAGNRAALPVGPIRIDTIAPVAQLISTDGLNANGWAKGPVVVTWACSDSESGAVAPTIVHTVSTNGTDQVTCGDVAGNTSTATSPQIRIDTVAPNVNILSPLNGFTYQRNGAVFATYLCSDNSGIASCVGKVPSGTRLDTSTPGDFTFTVTAADAAGNQTVVTRTYRVVAPNQ